MKGFTLLEVLVAMSIFAMIGLGANQLLRTVIDSRDATESRMAELNRLQRAFAMMDRDLVQLTNRPVRDEYGDQLPALELSSGNYNLELSRLGWRNPALIPRSNVQRVGYLLNGEKLERHYWTVLDRAEDSRPRIQVLLEGVEDFRVSAVNRKGDTTTYWPAAAEGQGELENYSVADGVTPAAAAEPLPPALEIVVTSREFGEISHLAALVEIADPLTESANDGTGQQNEAGDEEQVDPSDQGNSDGQDETDIIEVTPASDIDE